MKIHRAVPVIGDEEKEAILRVISTRRFILGDELKNFEKEFAKYCNTQHAIGVNSGTSALIIALMSLGIGKGDEVITVSNSFMATANAIVMNNANPVFVDIEPETFNIDPRMIEAAITDRTKAIIPVHLFGHPCDMYPILEIAEKNNLFVIEDAAQSHGAKYEDRKTGSLGDVACFSFYPTKNMTVYGNGGMIITNNNDIAKKCFALRDHGRTISRDDSVIFGFNNSLSEIQAAVGRVQLRKLDNLNEKRIKIARQYNKMLKNCVTVPTERGYAKHVYHLYTIKTEKRNELKKHLETAGIETSINYSIPIHLQTAFSRKFGFKKGMLPITEKCAGEILSIPIYPDMKGEEINYVAEKIGEFL